MNAYQSPSNGYKTSHQNGPTKGPTKTAHQNGTLKQPTTVAQQNGPKKWPNKTSTKQPNITTHQN